jgi:hypothetical protein
MLSFSISKGAGDNHEKWYHSRGFTNIMLVQWTGAFAKRIAIGQVEGLLTMEMRDERSPRWAHGGSYLIGGYQIWESCRWKTIRLV